MGFTTSYAYASPTMIVFSSGWTALIQPCGPLTQEELSLVDCVRAQLPSRSELWQDRGMLTEAVIRGLYAQGEEAVVTAT